MTWLPWWLASLVSNMGFITLEHINRGATGGWLSIAHLAIPLIFVAQWCLFHAFNKAPSWLEGWIIFTIGNAVMRLIAVNAFATGEVSNWVYVILGVAIMMGGGLLVKNGLS